MKDKDKTQKQPPKELAQLRRRIAELEASGRKRNQFEEALRQSEEKYRTILENIEDGYYEVDLAGNFTFLNDSMCRIQGYPRDELMGMNNRDYMAKETAKKVYKIFNTVLRTGNSATISDWQIIRKDGSLRDVESSVSLIRDANRNPVGFRGVIRDITERKKAEAALQKSEEKYRTVVELSPDGVAIASKGRHVFANQSLAKIFGVSGPEELVGKPIMDYIHPDYRKTVLKRIAEQTKSGVSAPLIEEKMLRADGTVIHTEVAAAPLEYQGEQAVLAVIRDITERKRLEEILEKEREDLKLIIDSSPIIVFYKDTEGRIIRVNKTFAEALNMPEENFAGKTVFDIYSPKIAQGMTDDDQEVFQSRHPKLNIIEQYESASGIRWVQTDKIPIFDKDGVPIGLIGFAQDITDRKQAEEKLRESEERYRDLVENINDILYATDEHGIITYVSPAIEPLSGYTNAEIIGRPFFEFVHQEDMSDVVVYFQQDISGQAAPREYRMVTKSGDLRWARTSSRPFFEGDRIVGLRGILTDITERKQAEEEVKRGYEQLQETLHSTVSALASTVEMKDQYTAGHQPRVTQLACAIAEEMGLSEDQIEGIRMAASIHDIGKIMVPAEILNKPGPLTEIQYEMIKMHPRAGYDILKGLKLPWPVAQIILQHHERQDGSGYPQGLSGEEIMVEARILAVANVVEAMNAHRPYRPAYDIKEALAEISKNRGAFYDATVVDACLRLFTEKGFTLAPVSR